MLNRNRTLIDASGMLGKIVSATPLDVKVPDLSSAKGFSMDAPESMKQRLPVSAGKFALVFENAQPGEPAVAMSYDRSNNGKTDTSLLGISRENWGEPKSIRAAIEDQRFD